MTREEILIELQQQPITLDPDILAMADGKIRYLLDCLEKPIPEFADETLQFWNVPFIKALRAELAQRELSKTMKLGEVPKKEHELDPDDLDDLDDLELDENDDEVTADDE